MVMSRTPLRGREESIFDPMEEEEIEDKGPTREEMAQQLADMQKELEEVRRVNPATLNMGQPLPQTQTFQPELVKLPDPGIDPDGFADAVEKNTRAKIEASQRSQQSISERQADMQRRLDNIWADFNSEHPDLAGSQDRIEFVSTKVLKKAKDRGVDVEKYMFNTPGAFIDDVAKEFVKVFGEPETDDDEDEAPRTRLNAKKKVKKGKKVVVEDDDDDEEDDSRAAAIFGGSEMSRRRTVKKGDDEGPDMIDDIHNMQRRMNIL